MLNAIHSDDSIAAVLKADHDRNVALVANDLETLDSFLAADFSYTHSTGKNENKQVHIKSLEEGLRYTKLESSELKARVITPDVITLNGYFDQIKIIGSEVKAGRFLFLAVWRRAGEKWQLTSLQAALPPGPVVK